MLDSPTPALNTERQPQIKGWMLGAAFAVLALLYLVGFVVKGEPAQIMLAGLQTIPFMLLAILAYIGIDQTWGKIVTLLWLATLAGLTALVGFLLSFAAVANIPLNATTTTAIIPNLAPGGGFKLLAIVVGDMLAVAIGSLGFLPVVRRRLSSVVPLDPTSFVHMVALVAVVTLMLLCYIPLLVLGAPPLLTLVANATKQGVSMTGGQDAGSQLRATIYGLIWTVPGTILAVGYGIRRDLRAALKRLGLVRPTLRQVLLGIGAAVLLVALVTLISVGIDWLWNTMGWPKTDSAAFGELLSFAFSPLGAVVIGVTAGLGEELAIRGVLQPRVGILLSNLFFTSLHAFQYNWDSMLIVFIVGTALGLLRKRANTSTSAIAHGTYNFLLIMGSVLAIPGFK